MKKKSIGLLFSILQKQLRNDRTQKAVVWSDEVNNDLTDHFGLFTDDNEHDFKYMKINFDWNIEKWYVYV